MSEVLPIEKIKEEIVELETERETLYVRFHEIEVILARKRKQVEVWEEIIKDQDMQTSLIKQMAASGLVEKSQI